MQTTEFRPQSNLMQVPVTRIDIQPVCIYLASHVLKVFGCTAMATYQNIMAVSNMLARSELDGLHLYLYFYMYVTFPSLSAIFCVFGMANILFFPDTILYGISQEVHIILKCTSQEIQDVEVTARCT